MAAHSASKAVTSSALSWPFAARRRAWRVKYLRSHGVRKGGAASWRVSERYWHGVGDCSNRAWAQSVAQR